MIFMTDKVFIDTNVLVYAHDVDAGKRHDRAAALIAELWETRAGVLSTQVLQELYVAITRKIGTPVARRAARELIEAYGLWQVEQLSQADIVAASLVEERYKLSFWDALIVVAARKAAASAILSEDLHAGQILDGIKIQNPFA